MTFKISLSPYSKIPSDKSFKFVLGVKLPVIDFPKFSSFFKVAEISFWYLFSQFLKSSFDKTENNSLLPADMFLLRNTIHRDLEIPLVRISDGLEMNSAVKSGLLSNDLKKFV
ncbi:MAG: hypothetical protein R2836_07975 [Chitinophagales bacterium]